MFRRIFILLILLMTSAFSFAQELPSVKVVMQFEHEGFLMWYAKQKGFDKELGFNLDLTVTTQNGMHIMSERNSNNDAWDVSAVTSIPLIMGSQRNPLTILAVANDESPCTRVFVRKDSDILKVQGWNRDYPDVYGSPETIKGKTFFISHMTSSAFVLARWLDIFDLDFSDVVVMEKKGKAAIDAMNAGEGDGMALWSPDSYDAEIDGYVSASSAQQSGFDIHLLLVADQGFAKKNPDLTARLIACYLMAVNAQEAGYKKLVPEYQKFLKEFSGKDYPESFCLYDLKKHTVYNLRKQLKFFNRDGNRKSIIQKIEKQISSDILLYLYENTDQLNQKIHINKIKKTTDKYLRDAKKILSSMETM